MESDASEETERNHSSASTDVPSSPEAQRAQQVNQESEIEIEPEIEQGLEEEETITEKPKRKYIRHKKATTKKAKSQSATPNPVSISHKNDAAEETDIAKQYQSFKTASKYNFNSEELYCICRKPDTGELMVACDGCDEWFHFKCMKLDKKYSRLVSNFFCIFCNWQGKGETLWKRKCRLQSCFNPISDGSKYCSKDHGLLYMKESLLNQLLKQDNLGIAHVKTILNYTDTITSLNQLGRGFPKLDIQMENVPVNVKYQLDDILKRLNEIDASLSQIELKRNHLSNVKDKVKLINEKLTNSFATANSRNKKKIEICGYNPILAYRQDEWEKYTATEEFKDDSKEAADSISDDLITEIETMRESDLKFEKMCILDKKKCPKHTGWAVMFGDEINIQFKKFDREKKSLNDKREMILKDYSIQIYENM